MRLYHYTAAVAALGFASLANAHSWVHQLRNIHDNGSYVGAFGYPRNSIAAGDPGFNSPLMQQLLPDPNVNQTPYIDGNSTLCHPRQQEAKQSSDKYPRLKSAPGSWVALRYLENGHVTLITALPNSQKPEKGGTVFVYGTTQPKTGEKLVDVLAWTKDGNGGDKRGTLLATNDFDDGRCAQINPSSLSAQRIAASPESNKLEIPCETDVQLPKDLKTGSPYTLYWVWQWNTVAGKYPALPVGKDEYYTTCMDIDMVDVIKADVSQANMYPVPQQDSFEAAVSGYKSRTALYTDAIKAEVGAYFNGSSSTPGAGGSGNAGAPSAAPGASSPAAPAPSAPPCGGVPAASQNPDNDIPTLTTRPGRPQPSSGGSSSSPSGDDADVIDVTVTDIVTVVITAVPTPVRRTVHATSTFLTTTYIHRAARRGY